MRFVQIEILPDGIALVDIDKLSHAVTQEQGTRLFLGAQHLGLKPNQAIDLWGAS